MQITQFTDYSLRVLLYLGLKDGKATVGEIAIAFNISRNHLVKVVHHLSSHGYINSYKGKAGGIELGVPASSVRIGDFVSEIEPMNLLECFLPETNTCPIQGVCQLERTLYDARKAFIDSLNRFTLADYLKPGGSKNARLRILGLNSLTKKAASA